MLNLSLQEKINNTIALLAPIYNKYAALICRMRLNNRWRNRKQGKPHNLPAQLIVSLTSYPDRFETLPLTLKSLPFLA